ncbi:MAG TPA: tetratricopeptide repeat protein [Herpetosiphonaceae bacterium]
MTELPGGTITFLFTDIEGSTLRWEQHSAAMQPALARHDALLAAAITDHGGVVFKTVGDAFYAAFTTAAAALAAALAAQRALQREAWDETVGPLRVRMALHTGAAELRAGDYFGPPLNRVARLLVAAHGEQILLSRATQELIRDSLPPGVQLRDLGEHRLKDLIRPEHIFQLQADDLRSDFPPLRTLDSRVNNLPPQSAPLLGREQELAELRALLARPGVRLVTLTGPGGTGKTRLSLQLGADLLHDFADGVFLLELAPIRDPALVASTIAHTLGVKETGAAPLIEGLQAFLRDKQMLLILDNFEQVAAAAPIVTALLRAAPRLKLLVTSRVVLRLYEEHEFLVAPLQTPNPKQLPPLERLSQYAAVALFIQRAQAVKRDFQITNENAPAVAEICARLDGLPLAIELAATRTKLLTPQALLARLDNRLKMLTGGARDLSARQQTLRGAIDWSYDLLDSAEQQLFARLAVFVGGWTLEAAEAICQDAADLDLLDGLQSLVDKSLVRQIETEQGEPRFMLLETIREYALERLTLSGAAEAACAGHASYYLELAEQMEPELVGMNQAASLDRLETEHNNLRAALTWARTASDPEIGLRLTIALAEFWSARGYYSEARRWLTELLARSTAPTSTRGLALAVAGFMAIRQGDAAAARPLFEESLALALDRRDQLIQARALHGLGAVAHTLDDYQTALDLLEQSLALSRQLNNRHDQAATLFRLGQVAHLQGDYALARSFYEQSLAERRALGDRRGTAFVMHNLGVVAIEEADHATARALFEQNLPLFRDLGDKLGIALSLHALAATALFQEDYVAAREQGEDALAQFRELGRTMDVASALELLGQVAIHERRYDQARLYLAESLVLCKNNDDLIGVAGSLEKFAALAEAQSRAQVAITLSGAAAAIREAIGAPIPQSDRPAYEQMLQSARSRLDDAVSAQSWESGLAMEREQVIAYALRQ